MSCKRSVNDTLTCSKSCGNEPQWLKYLKITIFLTFEYSSLPILITNQNKSQWACKYENFLMCFIQYGIIRTRTWPKSWKYRPKRTRTISHRFELSSLPTSITEENEHNWACICKWLYIITWSFDISYALNYLKTWRKEPESPKNLKATNLATFQYYGLPS